MESMRNKIRAAKTSMEKQKENPDARPKFRGKVVQLEHDEK